MDGERSNAKRNGCMSRTYGEHFDHRYFTTMESESQHSVIFQNVISADLRQVVFLLGNFYEVNTNE